MEWLTTLGSFWLTTLAWLVGLAVAFAVLARLMPCNPGMYWWKDLRAAAADAVYWLVVPLLSRVGRTLLLVAGVFFLFGGREPHVLPVKGWPLWQQCAAVLLIQDVILYWAHRLFHTRSGWGFHAVHHSPTVLDWTAAVRFHPVNNLLEFGLADVAVLLLGFSPEALLILAPFNVVYSAMVHANLNWTFGPLRYVFASPVFHRWHHTTREEGLDKNFASTFPFLDLLFGTFHMPPGKLPDEFGTFETDFPHGFWGQLAHPFRAGPRRGAALLTAALLTAATTAGGAYYYRAWRAEQQARRDREEVRARREEARAAGAEPARKAWAGGGLLSEAAFSSVAVSADGLRVVAGDEGGTVSVWDGTSAREPLTLTGHSGRVSGVAISADGRRVVSAGIDGTARVWDGASGEAKQVLRGHSGPVLSAAITPDGREVVTGGADGTVKVWDAATGRLALSLTADADVTGVAVSADGRRVVGASFKAARVWDAETGRETAALVGHADLVYAVAISPDGARAVTASLDGTAKVWDARTGREERTFKGHKDSLYGVTLGADGRRVVTCGNDRVVKVWDADTGHEEFTFGGHADTVTGVALSGDGGRVISAGRDGALKAWEAGAVQQTTALAPSPE